MKRSFKIGLLKRKQKRLQPRLRKFWSLYSSEVRYLSTKKYQRLKSLFRQKLFTMRKFKFLFGFYKTAHAKKFISSTPKFSRSLAQRLIASKLFLKLDNFLVRLGFFKSVYEAKQYIRNGAVFVNGKPVRSSLSILKKNDIVMIHPSAKEKIWENLRNRVYKLLGKRRKYYRRRRKRFKACVHFRNFSQFEINYKLLTIIVIQDTLSNSDSVLSFPYKVF